MDRRVLVASCAAVCSFYVLSATSALAQATTVAIRGVTVVDVADGSLQPEQTVLVEGNRINAIGATGVDVPSGAEILEGSGGYLIPGLWNMHAHLFNQLTRRAPNEWYFPLLVANGVTGVREMWTRPADVPTLEKLREAGVGGEVPVPRIGAAGALVDGPGSWWDTAPQVTTVEEARRFVQQVRDAGLDFVKVYSMLGREPYLAILDEAARLRLPVAGHVPLVVSVGEAAAAGQRSNEHLHQVGAACSVSEATILDERRRLYAGSFTHVEDDSLWERHEGLWSATYDPSRCAGVARGLAESGMWQVPTLVNLRGYYFSPAEGYRNHPWLAYVPAEEQRFWGVGLEEHTEVAMTSQATPAERRQRWEVIEAVVHVLAREGVPFLAGTDLGGPYLFPGFSLHTELELLVEAGLTTLQALQSATLEPARYLEATDSLGTVEIGKLADLVLLEANPLEDITNTQRIRAVIADGRLYRRADLDRILAEVEASARGSGRRPE